GSSLWRVAPWSIPLVAVPLVVFTMGVLSADAAKTDSWTLATQNLDALRGDQGCGLADDLVAAAPTSTHPLPQLRRKRDAAPVPGWVPAAPARSLPRFALGPVTSGSAKTPWFSARPNRSLGVFVAGPAGPETKLAIEFARLNGRRAQLVASESLGANTSPQTAQDVATWRFFAAAASSSGGRRADAVRVALNGEGVIGDA